MKLKNLLTSPLMLRRLVLAQERQAKALERIAETISFQFGGVAGISESPSEDEEALTYASDRDTWNQQTQYQRRAPEDE